MSRVTLLKVGVEDMSANSATATSKSSEHSLDARYEKAIVVHLEGTKQGLGIKIVGGRNLDSPNRDFGIYIKDIVPDFLAHKNGKLRIGDQILKANNENLVGVSNERAVEILRSCASTDSIQLIVARDMIAEAEYRRLSNSVHPATQSNDLHRSDIKDHKKASSSSSSLSTVSYTSDSSDGHQEIIHKDNGTDEIHAGRPLSAVSTTSGPPPPLPTSPPPDEQPCNSLNRNAVDTDDTNLVTTEHASKSIYNFYDLNTHEEPSPKVWTNLSSHSITPASTSTRSSNHLVSTAEAPNIYKFKSSGSNPKIAGKKLTDDDVTKIAKTEPSITKVTHRPKQGVSPYHHKRLSVNPINRYKFEKLIVALKYIGYDMTPQQEEKLTKSLDIDGQGKVIYEEFVREAQKIFSIKLNEMQLVQILHEQQKLALTSKPLPAIIDSHSLEDSINTATSNSSYPVDTYILPSLPPSSTSHSIEEDPKDVVQPKMESKSISQSLMVPSPTSTSSMTASNEATLKHIKELKTLLSQKEKEIADTKSDNLKIKKEFADLKKIYDHETNEQTKGGMYQKLAVMDCELRKKKETLQRYEVVTRQLCQFVENCHNVLANSAYQLVFHPRGKGEFVSRGDPISGNPRPPVYLAKHARKTGPGLAQEAKETLLAVRHVLSVEELPDGWEEQYDKDGAKYYIK